jgi:hypothetical protein
VQVLPIPDLRKQVAAHVTADRFYDGQGNGGGQGRIDGVSSLLQSRQPCLRCQRLARGDDAIGSKKRFPVESWQTSGGKVKLHALSVSFSAQVCQPKKSP